MASSDLFRREAVNHRRQKLYGDVVLTMPITGWAVTAVIALALLLLVSTLFIGTYARKETIGGWTRPDRGIVGINSPEDGVVETVHVTEGQEVQAGTPLATLRLDADLAQGGALAKRLSDELQNERRQLQQQYDATAARYDVTYSRLRDEVSSLEAELRQYQLQLALHERRAVIAQKQIDEQADLVKQGFMSKAESRRLEDALLVQSQAKEALVQDLLIKENRLKSAHHELEAVTHERSTALGVIGERLAALEQRLTEVSRRARVVLTAPVAGRVGSVLLAVGEAVKAKALVVDLLPNGGKLQAELFAPSRATGFLLPGATVLLRYDAYPYQKFGVSHGKVLRVSATSLDSAKLPAGLASNEPVYRVLVELDADHLTIDGRLHPLRSGMTLKADVLLEQRRLVEYLFGPFFGFAKRG